MSLLQRLRAPGPKRILALDGGGIRGALTLGYLKRIEAILRTRHNRPDLRLCDYFDLVGGTSTGAIMCRLENLPGPIALKRMMAAMVELFCDSFDDVPRRIVLDIDDTEDRVHGGQQLALFHAHYDSRCFLPIHVYEASSGKPVAVILRPGRTPGGAEVSSGWPCDRYER